MRARQRAAARPNDMTLTRVPRSCLPARAPLPHLLFGLHSPAQPHLLSATNSAGCGLVQCVVLPRLSTLAGRTALGRLVVAARLACPLAVASQAFVSEHRSTHVFFSSSFRCRHRLIAAEIDVALGRISVPWR